MVDRDDQPRKNGESVLVRPLNKEKLSQEIDRVYIYAMYRHIGHKPI